MLKLWQQNRGMIERLANDYSKVEEREDLKQEAYFGLCRAVESYAPDKGSSFLTWAIYWIRQSMQRYCQNNGTIRIPVHSQEDLRQYKKLQNLFYLHVGRLPNTREYCYYLGCSVKTLESLQRNDRLSRIGSIDTPVTGLENDTVTVGDTVADPGDPYSEILDSVTERQLKEILWDIVEDLPGKEPAVIKMRYQENLFYKEIAARTGITTEAARQWELKALRELRRPSRARQLRPFYDSSYIYSRALHGNGAAGFNRTWTSSTERVALDLL
nr:sigma-70 family RNA polymerase sigma factor [Blautia obeum]